MTIVGGGSSTMSGGRTSETSGTILIRQADIAAAAANMVIVDMEVDGLAAAGGVVEGLASITAGTGGSKRAADMRGGSSG